MDWSDLARGSAVLIAIAAGIEAALYILRKMRTSGVAVVRWWDRRRAAHELLIELLEAEERKVNGNHTAVD